MSWKNAKVQVDVMKPGEIIRITIEEAESRDPICVVEMQPEEFALAVTKNGSRRAKYLDIYKRNSQAEGHQSTE